MIDLNALCSMAMSNPIDCLTAIRALRERQPCAHIAEWAALDAIEKTVKEGMCRKMRELGLLEGN